MLNHENEIISVLPVRNANGCYMQKTYAELVKEISPEEIDNLYTYLEKFTEKSILKEEK